MADQLDVRRRTAARYVQAMSDFLDAYEELIDLDAQADQAGYAFVDGDFVGSVGLPGNGVVLVPVSIGHLDAATLAAARTIMTQLKNVGFDGGTPPRREALQKVRQ